MVGIGGRVEGAGVVGEGWGWMGGEVEEGLGRRGGGRLIRGRGGAGKGCVIVGWMGRM